jgi:hypothetical protein
MTLVKSPNRYNKAQQKELLERYEEYLIDQELTQSVIITRMTAAKTFLRTFSVDPFKIEPSDMERIREILTAKYSKTTAFKYLPSIGNFICFITGRNPWQDSENGASWCSLWMNTVRQTPCHLNKEIRVWSDHLKQMGYSDSTISEKIRKTKICVKALNATIGPKAVEDYSIDDMKILEKKLCDITDLMRKTYLSDFARFLEFYIGVYLIDEYKGPELSAILQDWAKHLRLIGMKESTVTVRIRIVTTVMNNLRREFGREFDPREVSASILAAYFNRAIDSIKECTLCSYFSTFASFSEWLNGTTGF